MAVHGTIYLGKCRSIQGQGIYPTLIRLFFSVLRKCGQSVETLEPFLDELSKDNIQSPHLLSTKILLYENVAQKQKQSINDEALKVKFFKIERKEMA
jgi:uncharacterized protein Yka (UPF0111/DUF47 family)